MLNNGLMVMINSDDPAYFGGYINKNYIESQKALNLSLKEVKTLIINSFKSSFLDQKKKKEWIKQV
jgi:adenosine deaminase